MKLKECNIVLKQFNVTFKLQLSGQTANFVQYSSKMRAEVARLVYVSSD